MAFSVDDQPISDDGPTVKQALVNLATWSALADEAKPLFEALLARLRTARDEVQRFYIAPNDQRDRDRVLKSLKDELVTFSIELQRYFGVRELTATPEPGVRWTEKMFASRVLQHKKLHRKLYEMHGGVHSSDNGLDRLFLLLKADEKNYIEWRDPFNTAVEEFKKAVADSVENTDMVDVYKRDALLALEAVMLLRNAETFSDPYEWTHNEPAKSLRTKLKTFKDLDARLLPDWFVPENDISYKKRSKNGSFGAIHFGTWASGTNVVVKCLLEKKDAELNADLREAFVDEANLWFKISHPYLLKLYGACHVTAPPFFVCEESKEGDLSDFLKTDRGKPRLWRLLFQSALAIEYLHGKCIVHGDLKLDNILVGADGYARVADFGMSRHKKPSRNLSMTVSETKLDGAGALRWRAPEALAAKAQLESDVYSFAMCLIQAIGGRIPYYDVEDDDEVRRRISAGELPERPTEMDDTIWELVKKMTHKDLKERAAIKDIIPELMKRANDELEREIDRTICPDCSWKLENGITTCPRCKRNIFEVGTIKSKEDLPAVIELLTLKENRHNHKGASALSDYSRKHQEEWISVFEAGAVPILSKILLDENGDAAKVDALKALGIVIVGSRLTQNATKYIMANRQIMGAVEFEKVLMTLREAVGEGEINLKTNAVKVVGFWPKRKEIDEELVSWICDAAGQGDIPLLQVAADRALKFLGVPTAKAG